MAIPQRESDLLASMNRHPSRLNGAGCADCDADGRGRFVPCEAHRILPLARSYIGTPSGHDVTVVEQVLTTGELLASWPLHAVAPPIGFGEFSWGYAGRGPTVLARSILRDALGGYFADELEVLAFRDDHIEVLDRECGFGMARVEVLSWIYDHRGHKGGSAVSA